MPLPYYRRLSKSDRRIYDASDRLHKVPVPRPAALEPWLEALRAGLNANDVRLTQKASHRLVGELLVQLATPPVTVRVLARRPSDDESELHGLYEAPEEGRPVIRAWMRTAVHNRPVAFKSFLRTLLHEVAHHLDFTLYALDDSFHTEGFFRREAHLARQLLGLPEPTPGSERTPAHSSSDDEEATARPRAAGTKRKENQPPVKKARAEQLDLLSAVTSHTRRS